MDNNNGLLQPQLTQDPMDYALSQVRSGAAQQGQLPEPTLTKEKRDLDIGLGDVGRLIGKGATDLVAGAGDVAAYGADWLKTKGATGAIAALPLQGAAAIGDLADSAGKSLEAGLSDDAKAAMGSRIFDENADGDLVMGDGAGDIDVWAAKFAHGIGTFIPTLASGGAASLGVKAGGVVYQSMLKRGASEAVARATAKKTVEKLASKAGTSAAVGMGTAGAVGMGGRDVAEQVNAMPHEQLMESETYRQKIVALQDNPDWINRSSGERLDEARRLTAEEAAGAVMTDPGSWAFAAGAAVLGDRYLYKMLAGKAAAGGVVAGAGKGAIVEGATEMVQEGGQQWRNNETLNEVAAADIDPMRGVLSGALEGGVIGAGTGGALGGVGGLRKQQGDLASNVEAAPEQEGEQVPPIQGDELQSETDPTEITINQSVSEQNNAGPEVVPSDDARVGKRFNLADGDDYQIVEHLDGTRYRVANLATGDQVTIDASHFSGKLDIDRLITEYGQNSTETGDATRTNDNPAGPSSAEFDETRDVPAYLRQDTELDGRDVRPTWSDDDAQQALGQGQNAPSPADLVQQQMEQGPVSESEPEQQTGGIETWQPNWRPGRQERSSRPETAREVEGEFVPRMEREQVGEANRLEGPAIDGQGVVIDESRGLGFNGAINMGGEAGESQANPNYVPPLKERKDKSVEPESMRDSRMGVGKAINEAGSEADAIWQQLSTLRVTKRGKPFASEKEAAMASRQDEQPVKLPEGYGIAKQEEVADAQAEQSSVTPEQREQQAAPQNKVAGAIAEVPVADLQLSSDVPQFKDGANKQGVVEPLGGTFDRTGVSPIQVWQRKDGRLEVISGRHRLDLARRSGEKTIPAQIHDEATGFDQASAATLDAELNIRDNQGKVKDYVQYFKATGIDRAEADRRGHTARALGRRSHQIATGGSEETIAAHRADILTDEAAERISQTAPGDARLQTVGIKAIQDGKSITHATNMMQAVKALGRPQGDGMGDMFGFDDSGMREAEQMATLAAKKQREISELLRPQKAVRSAGKLAEQEGITDNLSPEQRQSRMANLQQLKSAWDNWSTNPDLVAELRNEIQGEEAPALSSYSEADLQQQADDLRQVQEQEREAQARYDADQEVDDFNLAGSNAPADIAMAQGQNDMLTQTIGQAELEQAQSTTGQPSVNQTESAEQKEQRIARSIADSINDNPTRALTERAVNEGVAGALAVFKQNMKTSGRNVVFEVHDDNGVVAVGPAYPAFEKGASKAAKQDAEDIKRAVELLVSEGKLKSKGEQQAEPAPQPQTHAPLLYKSDGSPFATEKSARISKPSKDNPGATIEAVEGGFAVKPAGKTGQGGEQQAASQREQITALIREMAEQHPDNDFKAANSKFNLLQRIKEATDLTLEQLKEVMPLAEIRAAFEQAQFNGDSVTEVELKDRDLLKEHAGKWRYRYSVGGSWRTAGSKESALESAREAYTKAAEKGELPPTRDERFDQADNELFAEMDRRYGNLSMVELEAEHERLGGSIAELNSAGEREFNGGGRRTAAAVASEGARQTGDERLRLDSYIDMRREREQEPASEQRAQQIASDMTPERIRAELDGLSDKMDRLHSKAMEGADANTVLHKINFLSPDEQARYNDLKQALPSYAEDRAEARQNIERRAAERKAKRDSKVSKAGVTVTVPTISKELIDGYNRATHMGKGRDLNAELKGEAESLLDELAGKKHTLDTDEQKARATELTSDYLSQKADFHRWDASQAASNPSWMITGRDGRNMSKANAANEKHMAQYIQRVEKLERQRNAIADQLYRMRPDSVKADQQMNTALRDVARVVGDIASMIRDGKPALEKETRGWASPKAHKLINQAVEQDKARTISQLLGMNTQLRDVGGLVKVLGPRSNAGKLVSELLAAPSKKNAEAALAPKQWKKAEGRRRRWEADDGTIITDESFTAGGEKIANFFVYQDRTALEQGNNFTSGKTLTEAKQKAEQGEKPLNLATFNSLASTVTTNEQPVGLSVEQTQDIADAFMKAYKGNIPLKVIVGNTQEDIYGPEATIDNAGRIKGAYHPARGVFTLAARNLSSVGDAIDTIRHEVLGHYGLNTFTPADKRRILDQLIEGRNTKGPLSDIWREIDKLYKDQSVDVRAEEVFARVVEQEPAKVGKLKALVDRLLHHLNVALRKAGLVKGPLKLNDVRRMARYVAEGIRAGRSQQQTFPQTDDTLFRLDATATATESALDKLNLGPKPDVIDQAKEKLQALREIDRQTAGNWLTRMGRKANTELLDALAPIKYIENAIGITGADDSGYHAARLATGSSSTMLGAMLHGLPEWRNGIVQRKQGSTEQDALLGILQPLGKDLHNWLGWMAGHRAEILMAQGRENLLTADEIQALKDLGNGREQQFNAAKKKWNAFNGAILDLAQEAGLVSAEARAGFESEWYIPFFRETEDGDVLAPFNGKGVANQRSGIKQLKGGANKTNDLLENMFHTTSKMIDAAMKNHAARKTVENLMDTGIIEVIENPNLMDMRAKDKGQEVFSVRHNGEDLYVRTLDKDLFKAMTFLDRKPFDDPFTKVGMAAKRLLTATVTSSPEFMLRNFLRDALSAWTISKDKYNPLDAFSGAVKAYNMTGGGLDMMFAGASFMGGYVNANDPEGMADTIRKGLRRKGMSPEQIAKYEKSIIRNAAQAKGAVADAWAKYNRYGEAAENATREAVYEAALKAGKSKAQAAFEAKDQMDFSMLGASRTLQWFTSVLPFFNARVQGLGKLSREFKDNPTGMAKRGGMIVAGSLALLAINWDNEDYEALPDWDKDMHWHFWLGDQHLRIPKPFEVGVIFGTIPERMARAMGDKDTGAEFGKAVARAVGETFALNPIPQAVNPLVEVYTNYDSFKGRAIENQYEKTLMAEARYDERTSLVMREIGELTGMSPKQLEHVVTGYLGTMGAYSIMAADALVSLAKDEGDRPASRLWEHPIIKAVYQGDGSSPARSVKQIGQLYDMLDKVTELHNTVTAYRKDNRLEDANQLLAQGGDILRARKSLTRAQRQLRQIRNQMDLIRRDRSLNSEQKRERIDRLMARRNDLAARVVSQNQKWFE